MEEREVKCAHVFSSPERAPFTGITVTLERVSAAVFPEHNGRSGDSLSCQARMYSVCSAPEVGFFPPLCKPASSQQVLK